MDGEAVTRTCSFDCWTGAQGKIFAAIADEICEDEPVSPTSD
jgi:hypothetical protein